MEHSPQDLAVLCPQEHASAGSTRTCGGEIRSCDLQLPAIARDCRRHSCPNAVNPYPSAIGGRAELVNRDSGRIAWLLRDKTINVIAPPRQRGGHPVKLRDNLHPSRPKAGSRPAFGFPLPIRGARRAHSACRLSTPTPLSEFHGSQIRVSLYLRCTASHQLPTFQSP